MIKKSDHFDGRHYYNQGVTSRSLKQVLFWIWNRQPKPWPESVFVEQRKPTQERVGEEELSTTFINHSTCLIQIGGWNILTDPIWSERASPFTKLGPKRVALPGVKFEDLPPIDLVLLSHNHYDHMDLPTLLRLNQTHQPVFYVAKGNQAFLKKKGLKHVKELDWWDKVDFSLNYTLHFVPAQHFAARGIFDRNQTLWGGFVIKSATQMVYFAGDTGYCSHFLEIRQRLGSPTLAFLPIGAFEPRAFMQPMHMSPADAVEAHQVLGSKQSVAIHFGTFQLSDEGREEPMEQLKQELEKQQIPLNQFLVLEAGETKTL